MTTEEINTTLDDMGHALATLAPQQRMQASWIVNIDTMIDMVTEIDSWMSSPFEAFGGAPTIYGLPVEKTSLNGWRLVVNSSERYEQ